MLKRLGINDGKDLAVFLSLILLVAITPLGKEASHPLILVIYRTLLFVIVGCYAWSERSRLPRLSLPFLGGVVAVAAIMLISLLRWQGALFESAYLFYEKVLFIAAFITLAHSAIGRPAAWKHAVLASVVLIDVAYIGAAFIIGERPLLATFVNPNYFASFVLPGIAICASTVLLSSSLRLRIAAGAAGLFLYYGIGQTASRGATLAGLVLLGVAGIRAAKRSGLSFMRLALVGSLLMLLTIAVNPTLIQKFLDLGERDPNNYGRAGIWLGTLSMISEHPLTGVGLGHYYYTAKPFTPPVERSIAQYRKWPNIAHSEYLQYVADIGVPGALLLFGLGAWLLTLCWRRSASAPQENRIIQESALLAAAGLGAHALVDNNWTVPIMAVGLVVISQADLLPYQKEREYPRRGMTWGWRHALGISVFALWLDAALIPSIGLYFNELGHEAHAGNDFERAERNHRYALAVIPRHPVLLDNLGIVYLDEFMKTKKAEYLDRAEVLFSESMLENPRYDVPAGHLETVLVQRLTNNPHSDKVIHLRIAETDQHLLRANPFNPFIRKNLAEAFYNLGDRNRAFEELLKAIQIEPNYVPGYLRLAQWYEEAGEMEQSEKYMNHALQVVNLFKDTRVGDPIDNLLLGRPQSPREP